MSSRHAANKRLLWLLAHHEGGAPLRELAEWFFVPTSLSEHELVASLTKTMPDDLRALVDEPMLFSHAFWNVLIKKLGGEPQADCDGIVRELDKCLTDTDEESTISRSISPIANETQSNLAFPAFEDLSADAVLPWIKTELKGFQSRATAAVYDSLWRRGKPNALLCMPEAGGRMRIALELALGCVAKGERVLWLSNHDSLLDAVHAEIRDLAWLAGEKGRSNFTVSRFDSSRSDLSGDFVLATSQAVSDASIGVQEFERHGELHLVCVDDLRQVVDPRIERTLHFLRPERAKVLGLTGFALRAGTSEETTVRSVFGDRATFQLTFRDLVRRNYLAQPVFVRKRLGSSSALIIPPANEPPRSGVSQEVPQKVQEELARNDLRSQEVLGHWIAEREHFGKAILFAFDPEQAEIMAKCLRSHGIAADFVFPELDSQLRAQRLSRMREGSSEVLVVVGWLTEREQLPGVCTVIVAKPTTNPAVYSRMVQTGSHTKPGEDPKKTYYVLDCVDPLDRYGYPQPGKGIAAELASDFEMSPALSISNTGNKRQRRLERAIVSMRAWQILLRFANDQYSIWGEVVWDAPAGETKSVVVSKESIAAVHEAVESVRDATENGNVLPLRAAGASLDWSGALRDVDWQEMLSDCIQTGHPPRLEPVEDAVVAIQAEASARILASHVEAILGGKNSLASAMGECQELLAKDHILATHFHSAFDLRREVLRLYNDLVYRFESVDTGKPTNDRRAAIAAFVQLTAGVALADAVLLESEAGTIEKAAARVFDLTSEKERQWLYETIEYCRHNSPDVAEASRVLRSTSSRAELYCMFDWLFRIAIADGVFCSEEQRYLNDVAQALGIPQDERSELFSRYVSPLPLPTAKSTPPPPPPVVVPPLRYCTQCSYPRPLGAQYCVACGSEFPEEGRAALTPSL